MISSSNNKGAEIIGRDFACNLSLVHLEVHDAYDDASILESFRVAALAAAPLLKIDFPNEVLQKSRDIDPIVGVSFTGFFDFLISRFGEPWLEWWMAGRPRDWVRLTSEEDTPYSRDEQSKFTANGKFSLAAKYEYLSDFFLEEEGYLLSSWKEVVEATVKSYCEKEGIKTPTRFTCTQPSGCLDKDALRVFDQGLIYADEVMSPAEGEVKDLDLSVRGGVTASTGIANEELKLIKVTFKNRRTLRMTPDHRLSVNGQWVRADSMSVGMVVDHSLGQYTNEEESSLLALDSEHYTREYKKKERGHSLGLLSKSITTPKTMNEDLSYFLGALFGNGCMSPQKKRIRFSHGRLDILHRLSKISESLFGVAGSINKASNRNSYELCIASTQLYDWMNLNEIGKTSKSKDLYRIPLKVRKSSRKAILAFIAGLIDTDGCPRNGTFSIDLSSESFIRNLQQVGEAVGICFGISHNTKGENMQGEKSIWTCGLSRTKSLSEDVDYLSRRSMKLSEKPCVLSDKGGYNPYEIVEIQYEEVPDYSYDFAVEGVDDDDSWYWQGAIKSHNTKGLLSGGGPGWHPSYAQYYIRRITFSREHPVALACIKYGYNVIPSQDDRKEDGTLHTDPWHPDVKNWLVEFPIKAPWSDVVDGEWPVEDAHVHSRWDLYMQVQSIYSTHSTSATINFLESEIKDFSKYIYDAIQNNDGYISAALLAGEKFTMPRMPYEKITKEQYETTMSEVLARRKNDSFMELLNQYEHQQEAQSGGCTSDKCEISFAP